MDIINIAGICIVSAMICKLLDKNEREYSLLIKTLAAAFVLGTVMLYISPIFDTINSIFERTNSDITNLNLLFKAVGICYITSLAENICSDSGEAVLASQIRIAGKITLTLMSLPLVEELVSIIVELSGY